MKKIIALVAAIVSTVAFGQTFPVNNLQINGVVSGNVTGSGNVALATAPAIYAPTVTGGATVAGGLTVSSGGQSVNGGLIVSGGVAVTGASSFSTSITAPTQSIGNNSTNVASTAFVAKRGCPSIMDYGGDNTNTNDNSTAWTNTIAAAPNTSAATCVYFPPGKYKFTGAISYTLPSSGIGSITVKGEGLDNTILTWPSGQGMQINFPSGRVSAHVQDLSITTGTTNTGTGLAYVATNAVSDPASTPGSTVTNVAIHGDDGYVGGAYLDYWSNGMVVTGVTYVQAYNLNIAGPSTHAGTGMLIQGFGTSYAAGTAINSSNFIALNNALVYGSYVQGVTVVQSTFAGDTNGIVALASETGVLDGLLVTGCEFATTASGIITQTAVGNTQIYGNAFQNLNANGTDVSLSLNNVFTINDNIFESSSLTNTQGVVIGTSSSGGNTITGNHFSGFATGVLLQAGSSGVNVQSNAYNGNTTNVTNSAGAANTVGGGSP